MVICKVRLRSYAELFLNGRQSSSLRFLVQNLPECAAENLLLGGGGHSAGLEELAVKVELAVEFIEIVPEDIGAEDQLFEGADVGFRGVGADDVVPPEDGLEECQIGLFLVKTGAGEIEEQIGIPTANFGGPRVVRVAEVGTDESEFGEAAGDEVEGGDPHTVGADVHGFGEIAAVDDAGVEHDDHAVLLGAFVEGPVAAVVETILGAGEFAEAAEAGVMEVVDELEGARIVERHLTETEETIGVGGHEGFDVGDVFGGGDEEGLAVGGAELLGVLREKCRVAVVMDVGVDELGLAGFGGVSGEEGEEGQEREAGHWGRV